MHSFIMCGRKGTIKGHTQGESVDILYFKHIIRVCNTEVECDNSLSCQTSVGQSCELNTIIPSFYS